MAGVTTTERITTPFGYETTAAEVVEAVDLTWLRRARPRRRARSGRR